MARMLLILTAAVIFSAALWPDHVRADDRKIAQQIANVMKATGKMKDYDILVTYSEGTAQLQGTVSSNQQMRTALEITKASPNVSNVVNKLSVTAESQNPVKIRPAAPLDRPVRISPVAAEKNQPLHRSLWPTPNRNRAHGTIVTALRSLLHRCVIDRRVIRPFKGEPLLHLWLAVGQSLQQLSHRISCR